MLPFRKKSSSSLLRVYNCKICFVSYNHKDNHPMVIPCGHTICSACLRMLTKTACPFDRQVFDKDKAYKNMELIQLIDEREEAKRIQENKSEQFPQMCSQKHRMVFSGLEEPCVACENYRGGWKCAACKISICCKCSKRKPTKKCFNDHKTMWRGIKLRCVKC